MPTAATNDEKELYLEVRHQSDHAVEKRFGPFSSEWKRNKVFDGLCQKVDYNRFYIRFEPECGPLED